jgi:hypothetical protein
MWKEEVITYLKHFAGATEKNCKPPSRDLNSGSPEYPSGNYMYHLL